eukprot:110468-Chlamydomonas_euryale.AAC.1
MSLSQHPSSLPSSHISSLLTPHPLTPSLIQAAATGAAASASAPQREPVRASSHPSFDRHLSAAPHTSVHTQAAASGADAAVKRVPARMRPVTSSHSPPFARTPHSCSHTGRGHRRRRRGGGGTRACARVQQVGLWAHASVWAIQPRLHTRTVRRRSTVWGGLFSAGGAVIGGMRLRGTGCAAVEFHTKW